MSKHFSARSCLSASLLPVLGFAALLLGIPAPSQDSVAPRFAVVSAVAYGLVWLDVHPEMADVALDGSHLDAGVWLISVKPGRHDLRVRKPGFRTHYSRFAISPGQSLRLDVRLQPGKDDGL